MIQFNEIGQQLRAYRMESGLKAEEIAARLGVSRAALYRYEKGEVIKLDTVKRLAELLKISPLTLLGIGVEYYGRPSVIAMFTIPTIRRFLADGLAGSLPLSDRLRAACREVARHEIERMAEIMDSEPIGLQFGLIAATEPNGPFVLLRTRDRAHLAINPFPTDTPPNAQSGVAMITSAEDAVITHQRVAEAIWRDAAKGASAAATLRELVTATQG
jgi:transcriptional regulator with XRE-family HTH domain